MVKLIDIISHPGGRFTARFQWHVMTPSEAKAYRSLCKTMTPPEAVQKIVQQYFDRPCRYDAHSGETHVELPDPCAMVEFKFMWD